MPEPDEKTPATVPAQPAASAPIKKGMPMVWILGGVLVLIALSNAASLFSGHQYAAFLKVPADDVVNQALEYVFSRDKEFQQYREKHADVKVAPSLRVKKPVPVVAKSKAGGKQPLSIAQ